MASDSWARISGSSRRSPFQPDPFSEEEEMEVEEELRPEYTCPFCSEDFDMVGLCCHMDNDHKAEAKNERRRYYRKGSALTFIRKELREGNLSNVVGGSNWAAAANTDADPLLSSFMYNSPANDEQTSIEPRSSQKAVSVEETSAGSSSERKVQQPVLSEKDREERAERARKCEFVQGLLFSTFFDDGGF